MKDIPIGTAVVSGVEYIVITLNDYFYTFLFYRFDPEEKTFIKSTSGVKSSIPSGAKINSMAIYQDSIVITAQNRLYHYRIISGKEPSVKQVWEYLMPDFNRTKFPYASEEVTFSRPGNRIFATNGPALLAFERNASSPVLVWSTTMSKMYNSSNDFYVEGQLLSIISISGKEILLAQSNSRSPRVKGVSAIDPHNATLLWRGSVRQYYNGFIITIGSSPVENVKVIGQNAGGSKTFLYLADNGGKPSKPTLTYTEGILYEPSGDRYYLSRGGACLTLKKLDLKE